MRLLLSFWLLATSLHGQSIAEWQKMMQVEVFTPLPEFGYRELPVEAQATHTYHYRYYSPKEKLELRYFFHPETVDDPVSYHPHVQVGIVVSNLAVNDDTHYISGRELAASRTAALGADFAVEYFLTPKPRLVGDWTHARVLMAHRAGHGTVYVFTLFDDPNNPALDARKVPVEFVPQVPAE